MARKPVQKILQLIEQKEELTPIQGIKPGSINEWYVAQALNKMQYMYTYQMPFEGGRSARGGQVIDFVVYAGARPIAVYVGTAGYWHSGRRGMEDEIKKARVRKAGYAIVDLTASETTTLEGAMRAVRAKI